MANQKKRGTNRRSVAAKQLEEDLDLYQEAKESREFALACESFQYLSPKEKAIIQNKFAKPKNASQAKYVHALGNVANKIIIATGPAGTGKTLFATEKGRSEFYQWMARLPELSPRRGPSTYA